MAVCQKRGSNNAMIMYDVNRQKNVVVCPVCTEVREAMPSTEERD